MKSLLMYLPSPTDSTSFWRGAGPFSAMRDHGWQFNSLMGEFSWPQLLMSDALFLQRPSDPVCVKMAEMAKDAGLKVWVDYDDLITEIPPSNPAYPKLCRSGDVVSRCLHLADVATFSTDYLKNKLQGYMTRDSVAAVCPNAWDDRLLKKWRSPKDTAKNAFFWRGSETHDEDLDAFLDDLQYLQRNHPDWIWFFVGRPYWKVRQVLREGSWTIAHGDDTIRYFRSLEHIRPSVMLVPLKDQPFNRAKSNIAWLEGSYCGASVVAPDWDEWNRPGINKYTGTTFVEAVGEAIERRESSVSASQEYIKEHLVLSKVNQIRREILDNIL